MIADIVTTKINANPIPIALLGFLDIPKKGQIPKNEDKIIFDTNKQLITIAIIPPIHFTSYAFLAAFALAAFLFATASLIAVNPATEIPNVKNAPVG